MPLALHGLGFSIVDAVLAVLVALALLEWLFVAADIVWVLRPLGKGQLLDAEAPTVVLGVLQLLFGGFLPGLLLLVASRQIRGAIRDDPALETRRNDQSHVPFAGGHARARWFGRVAMAGLGAIWGVAGLAMFSNRFYLYLPTLIKTAAQGTPSYFAGWFHFWEFASSIGSVPAAYGAGILQLILAFALLAGFARALAYYLGMLVAIFVWVVPEAFGGPFASGAYSIGPGVVYLVGLLLLIALDAHYGQDVWTLDAAIERRFPAWARIAEVAVAPLPAIGRWHVRQRRNLSRAAELLFGVTLAASAAIAAYFRLPNGLAAIVAARPPSGPLGAWNGFWAASGDGVMGVIGWGLILTEGALAALLILRIGERFLVPIGVAAALGLWALVEGFGGVPGPGYTDPGVGVAEFFVFVALAGVMDLKLHDGRRVLTDVIGRPRVQEGRPETAP